MTLTRFSAAVIVATAACLASGLVAQSPTVVSGGGDALQQAVDAASPGDILEVRAATYTPTSVSKSVTILCDPGVEFTTIYPGGAPPVTVEHVPAGQRLAWVRGQNQPSSIAHATVIRDCGGVVAIEGFSGQAFVVSNSSQVSFDGCTMTSGCTVADSGVSFSSCIVTATSPCAAGGCGTIDVQRSRVELADTRVTGAMSHIFSSSRAGAAVRLDGGRLRVAGAGTILTSGQTSRPGTDAPAIFAIAGQVDLDPAAILVTPLTPRIQGSATTVTVPMPVVRVSGTATGQQMSAVTMAESASLTATLLDPVEPVVPTPFGDLWMQLPGYLIDSGTVPSSGERTVSLAVPLASFGQSWTCQAGAITSAGQLVIGPPSVVVFE